MLIKMIQSKDKFIGDETFIEAGLNFLFIS